MNTWIKSIALACGIASIGVVSIGVGSLLNVPGLANVATAG